MDASIQEVTEVLPVVVEDPPQQGPCIVPGKIDACDVSELARLEKEAREHEKVRAYWFVVWPESVNMSTLFRIMRESGYGIAVSPLHDKDVKDVETGELDKPHYHVLIRFPSARYLEPVRRLVGSWLFDSDGLLARDEDGKDATWYVRPVPDFAGGLRYLCHLDEKDKHHYPVNEVLSFGFIDLSMLYAKSVSDDVESYYQLIAWCRNNPTKSYADLMDAVFDSNDRALMRVLTRYSYTLKGYLADRGAGRKAKRTA